MSSIDKFIEYMIVSYAEYTDRPINEVRDVFVSGGISELVRRCPSPFISHGQDWRNRIIEKQLSRVTV